jgi:hypothetical protein
MRKFLGVAVLTIFLIGSASGQNKASCNRQCLEGFANQYLTAMAARDVSKAPIAQNARYTENAAQIVLAKPNEGLWARNTALTDYRLYVADPQAGQVAFVGLIREKGKPVILSARLKIENQRITEIESVVVRDINESNLWALKTPPAEFSRPLAPGEKASREELARISSAYFDAIEKSNSKLVAWHNDCYRLENGMWTAGPTLPPELAANEPKEALPKPAAKVSAAFARGVCSAAIDSGVFALIESIRPRRTPVIDEERGVTWGVYMFNHPGVKTVKMPDGSIKPAAYFVGQPNSMPMSELFKIKGGKIRDIMAVGVVNQYKSGSGWD